MVSSMMGNEGNAAVDGPGRHEHGPCLALDGIDHARTRAKTPQTTGICGRFHRTPARRVLPRGFRKKACHAIEELQADLDDRMRPCNEARTHQGRRCFGKTPVQTFLDGRPIARENQRIGEAA